MASKAKALQATPPASTPEPEPTVEALEAVEVLQAAPDFSADEAELGQEPSAFRWHLSRSFIRAGKREWETCISYPAGVGALTAEIIREEWGPGTYLAQLRSATGGGAIRKNRIFHLATPRGGAAAAPSTAVAAPTTAPAPASDVAALFQRLIDAQQAGFDRLAQQLNGARSSSTPEQMMDLALRMAERMQPKRQDSDSVLESVGRWFDMAERFRSGKDWTDLISEGIGTIKPLVEVAVTRLGGAPALEHQPTPDTAPAAANGNGAAAPVKKVEAPPMLQLVTYLQRQVRYLTGKARVKASANLYAEVVLDNLPAGIEFSQVLEALKTPGALDRLFSMLSNDDRIAAQAERAWFEELVREMIDFLEEQVTPAGDGGDTGEQIGEPPAA